MSCESLETVEKGWGRHVWHQVQVKCSYSARVQPHPDLMLSSIWASYMYIQGAFIQLACEVPSSDTERKCLLNSIGWQRWRRWSMVGSYLKFLIDRASKYDMYYGASHLHDPKPGSKFGQCFPHSIVANMLVRTPNKQLSQVVITVEHYYVWVLC